MLETLLAELRIVGVDFVYEPNLSFSLKMDGGDYVPQALGSDFRGESLNISAKFRGVPNFSAMEGMRLDGIFKGEIHEVEGDLILPMLEVKKLDLLIQGNFDIIDLSRCNVKSLRLMTYPASPKTKVSLLLGDAVSKIRKLILGGSGTIETDFSIRDMVNLHEMNVNIPTIFERRKEYA